jgi:hypothetical protein
LDTGLNSRKLVMSVRKRNQTAIEGNESFIQKQGFTDRSKLQQLTTPQNLAHTVKEHGGLSIFQHFTISNKYNEVVEKDFVPPQAPIDISQEE